VGSVNPDDIFTVGAIGSSSGAMGCMLQSLEWTMMQAIDQLTQRLSQLEEQRFQMHCQV